MAGRAAILRPLRPDSSNQFRTPIVGGNWKMNTDRARAVALARGVAGAPGTDAGDVVLFPPFVYLDAVRATIAESRSRLGLGGQDVCHEASGAFTGEVSPAMLRDAGCAWVLTGHSERRHVIGESDALVGKKTAAALAGGLRVVLCVGETLAQREAGETDRVNRRQLSAGLKGIAREAVRSVVVAYEPVWAIGTGRNASPEDAQSAHEAVRATLAELFDDVVARETRVVYGGSVKAANAADLFAGPDVDGGLIGGASLDAAEFLAICSAATARGPARAIGAMKR
jgi:triosephosphate isomerase